MLTWIFAHSDALCNFLIPWLVNFTPAQQRHALNFIEGVLVCPAKHKTLAALTHLLRLPHADEFAFADFFRASPRSGTRVRQAVTLLLLKTVVQIQARTGWRLLFLSVDDALCRKDIATHALEAVSFHYDHVSQRRQKGKLTNSSQYVTLHLQFGPAQFTLTWRLYLKRKVVTRLNRQRSAQGLPKLNFTKLSGLVEEMLDEIAPHLPPGCRVYVLFDSWYDNHHLEHFIRSHGWHWKCATRSNRSLSGRPLCQWWEHLAHQRIDHVSVRSATRRHVYPTRHVTGRLRRYPDPVIAIISKWDRRDRHPAYFLCSDTTLSVRTIFKYYGNRWQAEIVFTQMTKADLLTAGTQRNDITNLDITIRHHDPVDEELYQLPFLLKGRLGEAALHAVTKLLHRVNQTCQLGLTIHVGCQLLRLGFQPVLFLFQLLSASLVLGQRNHVRQIRFRQAFELMVQTDASLT